MTLVNEQCAVSIDLESKRVSGHDKTDLYNGTTFYNQTTRSLKKALAELQEKFTGETTMWQAMQIIENAGVRCRSYCSID